MTEIVHQSQEMFHGPSPEQRAITELSDAVTNGFDQLGITRTEDILHPIAGKRPLLNSLARPGDRLAAIDVRVLSDGSEDPNEQSSNQPGTMMRRIHLNPTLAVKFGYHGDSLTEYVAPDGTKSYVLRTPEVREEPAPGSHYRPARSHVFSWSQGDAKINYVSTPSYVNYVGKESAKRDIADPEGRGIISRDITEAEDINLVKDTVKEFLSLVPGNPDSPRRIIGDYKGQSKVFGKALINMIPGVNIK